MMMDKLHMKKLLNIIYHWYLDLFFFGLEIMMIILRIRPVDYAVQEYNQVRRMGLMNGFIQMLINNEDFY